MDVVGAAADVTGIGGAIANLAPTHRQCTIVISNECQTYTLRNPRQYINSGGCQSPLPPIIASSDSGSAVFIKTPHTACGSVGVFTYDLHNAENQATEKIAVMFSVPYDFNWYSNWYAVGIFDKNKECDYDLYCEMYYNGSSSFKRGKANGPALHHRGDHVEISATMSDTYQPVMKLHIAET